MTGTWIRGSASRRRMRPRPSATRRSERGSPSRRACRGRPTNRRAAAATCARRCGSTYSANAAPNARLSSRTRAASSRASTSLPWSLTRAAATTSGHPAHAVAVAGGEVLRDHPAVGLTHDEVGTTAQPLGDGVCAVVGHVGDGVARRQVAPARHVPDGVAGVDERLEPPLATSGRSAPGAGCCPGHPRGRAVSSAPIPRSRTPCRSRTCPGPAPAASSCGSPPSRGSRPTVAHPDAGREGFEAAGSHRRVGRARDHERNGQADLHRGADDVTCHATEPAHRVAACGDGTSSRLPA